MDDLADCIKLMGSQQKEAEPFGPNVDAEVKYTEVVSDETVQLPMGRPCQLPFFKQPVVFLTRPQQVAPGQTPKCNASVSRRLVERTTTLSKCGPWIADNISGTLVTSFRLGSEPSAIAIADGEIFVTEWLTGRIVVFNLSYEILRVYNCRRSMQLHAIAVVGDLIFVAVRETAAAHRSVVVMQKDGTVVRSFGSKGHGISALAASGDHVYTADNVQGWVRVSKLDGTFVRTVASTGTREGQLSRPSGVAIASGLLFVADSANNRISVHNPVDGTFVRSFGVLGAGDGQFNRPGSLVAVADRLFVSDVGNQRISVYAFDGTFVKNFQLDFIPKALAADGNLLYVADLVHRSIHVFK